MARSSTSVIEKGLPLGDRALEPVGELDRAGFPDLLGPSSRYLFALQIRSSGQIARSASRLRTRLDREARAGRFDGDSVAWASVLFLNNAALP